MPLYEYKCDRCGETFEIIQKFSDEPLKVHPVCGGPVERLLSAPALQFKGTGWYVTDYGKKNGHSGGGNGKSAPANKERAAGTKSESKPAATPSTGNK